MPNRPPNLIRLEKAKRLQEKWEEYQEQLAEHEAFVKACKDCSLEDEEGRDLLNYLSEYTYDTRDDQT